MYIRNYMKNEDPEETRQFETLCYEGRELKKEVQKFYDLLEELSNSEQADIKEKIENFKKNHRRTYLTTHLI